VARDLGIVDATLLAGPDNVKQIKELTDGHGVEKAVECSGAAPARKVAIQVFFLFLLLVSQTVYHTKGTRAHTQRELI